MGYTDASIEDVIRPDHVTIWNGAISDIPRGWVLCDGNNGTPDLTDRFVLGSLKSYASGDTGGTATHTITNSEMASHGHGYDKSTESFNVFGVNDPVNNPAGDTTTSAGGDSSHENRPRYHALAFIASV